MLGLVILIQSSRLTPYESFFHTKYTNKLPYFLKYFPRKLFFFEFGNPNVTVDKAKGRSNVLFTLNRTTHSSKTLLCVVQINVNKTLYKCINRNPRIPVIYIQSRISLTVHTVCKYVYIGKSFTSLGSLMLNQRVSAQIGSRKGHWNAKHTFWYMYLGQTRILP